MFVSMSFKWQDKHMELFLETYQQYECLWNNKFSDYSKTITGKAYSLMLTDLNLHGLTVADIKAKIKMIRTCYGAELSERNSERSGTGVDDIYESMRLLWFKDADVFLRNVFTPKASSSNLKDLKSTGKDTSRKATNDSQHLEQLEQQTEQTTDIQDTEAASPDIIETSSVVTTNTPKKQKD